ncbi:MAG: hypothetical protein LDL24_00315, partial [Treponema sp.]|nr:hypothetical protein [Treponema sp.]
MNKKSFHQNILIIFLLISAGLLLPAQSSQKLVAARDLKPFQSVLVGTTRGLYRVDENTAAASLWTGGMVKKILVHPQGYYLLTDKGIVFSKDLSNWEERNQGLPVKVLKEIAEGKKQFVRQIQDLKDLEYNPSDPSMLVTATKDGVYLSRDGGLSWKNLGMPPAKTNGLKAVAAANMNNGAVVFATHGIYGVFALPLGSSGSGASQKWISLNQGLELHETTENPDEVSDILVDNVSGSL